MADAPLGNGRAQMAVIHGIVPVSTNVSGILALTILKIVDMHRVLPMWQALSLVILVVYPHSLPATALKGRWSIAPLCT